MQIESLQNVCKNLREKIEKNEVLKENVQNNFVRKENNNLKSGKNVIQLKEKNISNISDSDNDFENDVRYKTFSNLNDLLAEESDFSCKKENSKKFEKTNGKKKKKNNFKRYSFDLDYIFEINLNTYENFFC